MDKDQFPNLIEELLNNFNATITPRKLRVWYEKLSQELTLEELELAIDQALFECQFMPTGRKFIELAKGDTGAIAQAEWEKLVQGASRGQ